MTRPDWCPVDVWEAAISVQYQEPGLCLANSQIEPTARAILAERERCASIAEVAAARAKLYGADAVQRVCDAVHRSIANGWEAT